MTTSEMTTELVAVAKDFAEREIAPHLAAQAAGREGDECLVTRLDELVVEPHLPELVHDDGSAPHFRMAQQVTQQCGLAASQKPRKDRNRNAVVVSWMLRIRGRVPAAQELFSLDLADAVSRSRGNPQRRAAIDPQRSPHGMEKADKRCAGARPLLAWAARSFVGCAGARVPAKRRTFSGAFDPDDGAIRRSDLRRDRRNA